MYQTMRVSQRRLRKSAAIISTCSFSGGICSIGAFWTSVDSLLVIIIKLNRQHIPPIVDARNNSRRQGIIQIKAPANNQELGARHRQGNDRLAQRAPLSCQRLNASRPFSPDPTVAVYDRGTI
jgi:hypothetical protein